MIRSNCDQLYTGSSYAADRLVTPDTEFTILHPTMILGPQVPVFSTTTDSGQLIVNTSIITGGDGDGGCNSELVCLTLDKSGSMAVSYLQTSSSSRYESGITVLWYIFTCVKLLKIGIKFLLLYEWLTPLYQVLYRYILGWRVSEPNAHQ